MQNELAAGAGTSPASGARAPHPRGVQGRPENELTSSVSTSDWEGYPTTITFASSVLLVAAHIANLS